MLQPMQQLKPMSVFAGMCAASARDNRFAVALYVAPDVQAGKHAPPSVTARILRIGNREIVSFYWVYQAFMQEWTRRNSNLNWKFELKSAWQAGGLEWDSIFAGYGTWQYEAMWYFHTWWAIIPGIY